MVSFNGEVGMVFWIIAAVVVAALAALAWWSSGRQRRGLDPNRLRRSKGISESDVGMRAGRPTGGGFRRF